MPWVSGPHRSPRLCWAWRPVRSTPSTTTGWVPRLGANPHRGLGRGDPHARAGRRTGPGVLHVPRAAALRGRLPDHLGALHRHGGPRRHRSAGPDRGRRRRDRLAEPKCRLKTRVAVEAEATAALTRAGATRRITFSVTETIEETYRQERRGRPGANTRYRKHTRTRHAISWDTQLDVLAYDAVTDGCFPPVTNDTTLTDPDVLAAYRYQPNLERRHHLL